MPLPDLLAASATARGIQERRAITGAMMTRMATAPTVEEKEAIWPSVQMREREEFAGLYPDPQDPQFAARLYQKKEFYEARAVAAGVADGSVDPCSSNAATSVFELTPVQRIVARFMHPRTPFNGLLLYHGVGVGKTCSAVTIAENFLAQNPMKKVIVLAPQALRDNFLRTVFDFKKLVWVSETGSKGEGQWKIQQCTGSTYLERLNLLNEPDEKTVTYRVTEDIRNRYKVSGYLEFVNWLKHQFTSHIPATLTGAERADRENELIRRMFSDNMIIIDEAHNLRDLTENSLAPAETTATGQEAENKGGKELNPFLKRIALHSEGLKIVLMTATPMYNSAPEIVLLLNILMLNDTKKEGSSLKIDEVFTKEGDLKGGTEIMRLEKAARAYVSYMRGENPYTFPLRMRPSDLPTDISSRWPIISATSLPVDFSVSEMMAVDMLPIVMVTPVPNSPVELQLRGATTRGFTEVDEDSIPAVNQMLDTRMQIANISYPNGTYGTAGFTQFFADQITRGAGHKLRVFKFKSSPDYMEVDSIFKGDALLNHAPKIHKIIEYVKRSRGISFIYSRYINAGALPLAIALERVGFQRKLGDGSVAPLLQGSSPVPPICALCGTTNTADHPATHAFSPAYYILLTSSEEIAPQFASLVQQATTWDKADPNGPRGTNVKVIIGSQVASEGLDLKCVREVHILDAWFHLNRIDQIVGRAIRYCSHSALPTEERNCLIYLYAALVEETALGPALETADLYAYRLAIGKAQRIGRVQRLLKRHAWDCNLELEAITFAGLPPRRQIDAQGHLMEEYDMDDQDYTTYCDYQECKHECKITLREEDIRIDESSYQYEDARSVINKKRERVRRLFDSQIMVPETLVKEIFSDLPWEIASEALLDLLDGRQFRLTRPDGVEGFLIKKAGYLVFQPAKIHDTEIPIALRYARGFQLTRQKIQPSRPVWDPKPTARAVTARPGFVGFSGFVGAPVPTIQGNAPGGVAAAPPVLPVLPPPVPVAPVALEAPPPPEEEPLSFTPELSMRWDDWYKFITEVPEGYPTSSEISDDGDLKYAILWTWIIRKFHDIGEDFIKVAIQWWIDRRLTFTEQRIMNEVCLLGEEEITGIEILKEVLSKRHYVTPKHKAYVIFNAEDARIESYLLKSNGSLGLFVMAAPAMAKFITDKLVKPVDVLREVGVLFGMNALKKEKSGNNILVFKSVDKSGGLGPKVRGAECGIVSNLTEPTARSKLLQGLIAGVEDHELNLYTLLSDPTVKKSKDIDKNYVEELSKNDLCLYLEFLTRIMDQQKFNDSRWFLDAIETVVSWKAK